MVWASKKVMVSLAVEYGRSRGEPVPQTDASTKISHLLTQTSNYSLQVSTLGHNDVRLTRLHSGLRYEHLTLLE